MPKRSKSKRKRDRTRSSGSKSAKKVLPVSLFFDHKNKRAIFTTRDMLWNQLRRETPEIEASFDRLFEKDIDDISELFGRTTGICGAGLIVSFESDDHRRNTCAHMLVNSLGYLVSALQVLRAGHRLQPPLLMRAMIETLAMVLHLTIRPTDFQAFLKDKLNSSKSVSIAKAVIPDIGALYGQLSKQFAHASELHRQPNAVVKYEERDDAVGVSLNLFRVGAWIAYLTAELLFLDVVAEPRYWEDLGEGRIVFNPSETERDWMNNYFDVPDDQAVT